MSTSRVSEELKRIYLDMKSLTFSMPKTSLMYVFLTLLRISLKLLQLCSKYELLFSELLFLSWFTGDEKSSRCQTKVASPRNLQRCGGSY